VGSRDGLYAVAQTNISSTCLESNPGLVARITIIILTELPSFNFNNNTDLNFLCISIYVLIVYIQPSVTSFNVGNKIYRS
jgi:hypothetical protein